MRNHLDTVMLFCAGRGTRMAPLTDHRAKPMVEVSGRPLVDHALEQLDGIERRFANTHYMPEKLEAHLVSQGVETAFEPQLLEAGGGLKSMLPRLQRNCVFTMNTDAVWLGPQAGTLLSQHWKPDEMDALMLTIPISHAHAHKGKGDFIADAQGRLKRGSGDVYSGLQIIKTQFVADVSDVKFSLSLVWKTLLERETLFGVNYPGSWCDVGYPEAIPIAESLLET